MRMLLFSTLRASGRVSSTILVARFIRSPRIGDRMSSSLLPSDFSSVAGKCVVSRFQQLNHRSRRFDPQRFLTEGDHPPVVINGDLHGSGVEVPTLPLNRIAIEDSHGTHGAGKPI
jgi:hypothetical protein